MSKNELIFKHASLETSVDVVDTLEWKLHSLEEAGLPIDTSLADYIAFSCDNLEGQLEQLKAVKKELADREKSIKAQLGRIKEDGATFLLENGLERLDGVICSSVTVTKARESATTTTESREFVMNISQAELEELLIGLGKAEIKTVVSEKMSNAIPAKLKINKRKVITPEVE